MGVWASTKHNWDDTCWLEAPAEEAYIGRMNYFIPQLLLSLSLLALPRVIFAETDPAQLFSFTCGACHTINPPPRNAPPVRGIVMNYAPVVKDRAGFVEAVVAWAKSPALAKSHMQGAVAKFGLMPPFPIPEAQVRTIAGWMWDSIKAPAAGSFSSADRARQKGEMLSLQLMKEIRGALESALQGGDLVQALSACSEKAVAITHALNRQQQSGIVLARVSEKYRNPANKPTHDAEQVLHEFEISKFKDALLKENTDGSFSYYRPLFVDALCLSCHGDPKTFSPELSAELRKRYPGDKATGYRIGDFRGLVRADIPAATCMEK